MNIFESAQQERDPRVLEIESSEAQQLRRFFGSRALLKEKILPKIPGYITSEQIKQWEQLGFDLHYLPDIELQETDSFPGWENKPDEWFYKRIADGQIPKDATRLPGTWVLIDNRRHTDTRDGPDEARDSIFDALTHLRQSGFIGPHNREPFNPTPRGGTRFGTSWNELHKPEVKEALAVALGVDPENLRLPRAIEYNYIDNAYYPPFGWGGTQSIHFNEWLEDDVEKNSALRQEGTFHPPYALGMKRIMWHGKDAKDDSTGFRILVELPGEKKQ